MLEGGIATFSSGGQAVPDSYLTVTYPEPFCTNSYVTVISNPAYISASSVGQANILATNIIPTPNNNTNCCFYRRYSYLPPADAGQTALYGSPLRFCWLAIGR
jgi:hypothetical protein